MALIDEIVSDAFRLQSRIDGYRQHNEDEISAFEKSCLSVASIFAGNAAAHLHRCAFHRREAIRAAEYPSPIDSLKDVALAVEFDQSDLSSLAQYDQNRRKDDDK